MGTIAEDRERPERRSRDDTDWAARLTSWAIWLILIGRLVSEILGQTEVASLGFYTFHAVDPAVIVTAAACAAHLARVRLSWHAFTLPIIAIALLISINFGRGLSVDRTDALLWIRANGGIAVTLLLAVTMRPSIAARRTVRRALVAYSVAASVLLLLREATHPTLFMTADVSDFDANDGGRGLSAGGTFLMVLTSGILLAELLQRGRFVLTWRTAFTLALPLLVVLTRQGTATICEAALVLMLLAFQPGPSRNGQFVLTAGIVLAVPLILGVLIPLLQGNAFLSHRADNLNTRRMIWDALMAVFPLQSFLDQAIGFPGGQRPLLYVPTSHGYTLWEASIHSMYYGSLPMMGYLGAACFILLLAILAVMSFVDLFVTRRLLSAVPLACCAVTAILANSYEVRGAELLGLLYSICLVRVARQRAPGPRRPLRAPTSRRGDASLKPRSVAA